MDSVPVASHRANDGIKKIEVHPHLADVGRASRVKKGSAAMAAA
jgi:hypothetical protein